jgi:hypothetical protein
MAFSVCASNQEIGLVFLLLSLKAVAFLIGPGLQVLEYLMKLEDLGVPLVLRMVMLCYRAGNSNRNVLDKHRAGTESRFLRKSADTGYPELIGRLRQPESMKTNGTQLGPAGIHDDTFNIAP